ncbi:MAG: transglycosylase SLT domain-containing protein [Dokdonella sp.]|uniref:transglycosylase SLT domain-containing protein n=1 Tax=Dokdonella sp. TaxID=2291710 RepID=UPI0025BE89AE|nr:transglycosylase SLT domain-containing protein [Dokdonella sp.]MBX3699401.1 transglycosylase SLT domain-containing protein [Dokdonella sp.]
MQVLQRFALCAALAALAGCAGTAATRPTRATAADAAGALYARLDAATRRYANGLDLQRRGDAAAGDAELRAALDDLRDAASACVTTRGCDGQRFVAGFDALLRGGLTSADAGGEGSADAAGDSPGEVTPAGEGEQLSRAMPELGRSVTLLKGRELSELIEMNGPVQVALEEWLTQYRPNLMTAYVNYQYLRWQMAPEYDKAGLPEALLFGMLAKESGGKVHAVSRSGASGPLQFMYATGLRFGLRTVDGFDQRFDPRLSARANAAYINEQLAIFNNNLELVIGAYNGGEGAMQRRAGRGESALSFWNPQIYYGVSQETREYVPMVLAAAWLFMHPERYNLEWPKIAMQPGSITLQQPASIAELTICLGQDGGASDGWFRALRNLNPQLDPQQAAPAGSKLVVPQQLEAVYARNCAAGRWQRLASELHAAALPPAPPGIVARVASRGAASASSGSRVYVVRKGDTVAAIARKTSHCSMRDIADHNALRAPHYPIKPGQRLQLPACAR